MAPLPATSHGAFASSVSAFLRASDFGHQRHATYKGSHLLLVRSPCACLALHLLPTPSCEAEVLPAETSAALSDAYAARRRGHRKRAPLVHLWQDQWLEHNAIVCSRLLSMLGRSDRVMARSTTVRRIDAATIDAFLLENHLWGATKARYRYGCYSKPDGRLVAVASFSARWNVRRRGKEQADARASHELIRYCSSRGVTVVGGISKLLAAFTRDASPDEIVTVIDRDWGAGDGWRTLGFTPLKKLPPVTFFVGPDGLRCHPGAGPNPHRRRLPPQILDDLAASGEQAAPTDDDVESDEAEAATERFLAARGYFAVRDAGAERHLKMVTPVTETVD